MIVITGAAGFIGSYLAGYLLEEGYGDLVLVDRFDREDKAPNYTGKTISQKVDRDAFPEWLAQNHEQVQVVFHLGARTDTTEHDYEIHRLLNLEYSKKIWTICAEMGIPLIYASSAATYGLGELGYDDNHEVVERLKPLNAYGRSKNEFDIWVLKQAKKPPFWAGLKFFNVYGPNEYHKGRMASVIFHAFHQIRKTDGMKLFRSHNPDYKDGEQLRDFIYVKDVASVCRFLMEKRPESGLYNLGTGTARTFLDLTRAVFKALDKEENIGFIDTPEDIRDKYQYFTEANMNKLWRVGYTHPFTDLESGVKDYVQQYLLPETYH